MVDFMCHVSEIGLIVLVAKREKKNYDLLHRTNRYKPNHRHQTRFIRKYDRTNSYKPNHRDQTRFIRKYDGFTWDALFNNYYH